MNAPSTESKPTREKLLPQASIRFFLLMIVASALVMYCFRAAFVDNQFWAKIASLLITSAGGCFIVYAVLFLLANLFTATTDPIRRAIKPPQPSQPSAGESALSETGEA